LKRLVSAPPWASPQSIAIKPSGNFTKVMEPVTSSVAPQKINSKTSSVLVVQFHLPEFEDPFAPYEQSHKLRNFIANVQTLLF
jgi:hypothetical protein